MDVQAAPDAQQRTKRDFRCVTNSEDEGDHQQDMTYHIHIPNNTLPLQDMKSGNLHVTISHANKTRTPGIEEDSIQLTGHSQIDIVPPGTGRSGHRQLYKTKGDVTMLVVRVISPDMQPTLSAPVMSDKVSFILDTLPML